MRNSLLSKRDKIHAASISAPAPTKKKRRSLSVDLIDRVDAAIVASLQAELIEAMTGRALHKQTPQALTLMISSLSEVKGS